MIMSFFRPTTRDPTVASSKPKGCAPTPSPDGAAPACAARDLVGTRAPVYTQTKRTGHDVWCADAPRRRLSKVRTLSR